MATQVDAIADRRINLYEILQVSPKAGPEVIQAAYRALARTYHPDVNASPDAARQMRQLNAAYGVLSDPQRRARYDEIRQRPARLRRHTVVEADIAAAAASVSPASASTGRPRPSYIRPVPTMSPPPVAPQPRVGRLIGVFMFMVLIIAAAVYGLWLIAAALDDEPMRAMAPMPAEVSDAPQTSSLMGVPAEILSAVLQHNDSTPPMGR
jgi:DnaJ-domain-containing protein 1